MSDYSHLVSDPANGKLKYLRPFIVLVPTLIVCIFNIYTGVPLSNAVWRLLITILVFFVIGTIAQNLLRNIIIQAEIDALERQKKSQKEEDEDSEDEDLEDGEETEETEQMEQE